MPWKRSARLPEAAELEQPLREEPYFREQLYPEIVKNIILSTPEYFPRAEIGPKVEALFEALRRLRTTAGAVRLVSRFWSPRHSRGDLHKQSRLGERVSSILDSAAPRADYDLAAELEDLHQRWHGYLGEHGF